MDKNQGSITAYGSFKTRYRARVMLGGKLYYLGMFATYEDAQRAVRDAQFDFKEGVFTDPAVLRRNIRIAAYASKTSEAHLRLERLKTAREAAQRKKILSRIDRTRAKVAALESRTPERKKDNLALARARMAYTMALSELDEYLAIVAEKQQSK